MTDSSSPKSLIVTAAEAGAAVDEKGAASITGYSISTLQKMRSKGNGPPFVKLSPGRRGAVRYQIGNLHRWLAERTVSSTSDPACQG